MYQTLFDVLRQTPLIAYGNSYKFKYFWSDPGIYPNYLGNLHNPWVFWQLPTHPASKNGYLPADFFCQNSGSCFWFKTSVFVIHWANQNKFTKMSFSQNWWKTRNSYNIKKLDWRIHECLHRFTFMLINFP